MKCYQLMMDFNIQGKIEALISSFLWGIIVWNIYTPAIALGCRPPPQHDSQSPLDRVFTPHSCPATRL